jgi:tol-pal system protein YbgF
MKAKGVTVAGAVLAAAMMAGSVQAADAKAGPSMEQRLTRLERLLENQFMNEILDQVRQVQKELRAMRDELEVLNHEVKRIKKRQRDLYVDVDRRVRKLEVSGVASAPPQVVAPDSQPASQAGAQGVAAATSTTETTIKEQSAYQSAFNRLKEGHYDQAIKSFQQFLAAYPQGNYADNAQYWLGEANYVTRHFDEAMAEFLKVKANYPDSPKVSDALLKVGFIHYEKGEWDQARAVLEEVINTYPKSTAARLADTRLKRMTKEGH